MDGNVTVTGTPLERRVADVTSTVSAIAAIDASNADYVMDMIDQLPGVYVRKGASMAATPLNCAA